MPTADPAQQRALLDVQALDTRSRQATHRGESLPEHADLRAADQQHADVRAQLDAATQSVADLERDLRKAEADVEDVRVRIDRDRSRLDAGTGSADVLTRLEHEIGTLTERRNALEDAELEVMEALESATAEQGGLQSRLDDLATRIQNLTSARDAALAEIGTEQDQLAAERARATAGVEPALLALYEKVRTRTTVAAAELAGNRCGGCRMEINPVEIAKLKALPPEAIAQCEECGAILVR